MVRTIGNPLSWSVDRAEEAARHLRSVAETLGGDARAAPPEVRRIGMEDIREALREGVADFAESRTDVMFLCLIYPLIGLAMAWLAFDRSLLPLIFPIISGFALVGPVAAVGLYEMSRRRERGEAASWIDGLAVVRAPAFGAIFVLGLFLVALFVIWVAAAHGIYLATLGPEAPASLAAFLADALTTGRGWAMIGIGMGVGFCFAATALAVSLVSFPLLLDRNVGLPVAVVTSVRVAAANPKPVAAWGLIVAGALALGSIPLFLGLIVALPILGHATWRLYRKAVG